LNKLIKELVTVLQTANANFFYGRVAHDDSFFVIAFHVLVSLHGIALHSRHATNKVSEKRRPPYKDAGDSLIVPDCLSSLGKILCALRKLSLWMPQVRRRSTPFPWLFLFSRCHLSSF